MTVETSSRAYAYLIVDVDSGIRAEIEAWIEKAGLGTVFSAHDLLEAVKILDSERIDCVIGTWELMGVAGGLSLLKLVKLQERFRQVAFVMISEPGANEAVKVKSARASKADGYLLKPLNETALIGILREIHARK